MKDKIIIKTPEQIAGIRLACQLTADILVEIAPHVVAGVSTEALDNLCAQFTADKGAVSACLGFHGYTKYTCISVNHVVCHGIPSADKILKNGDIVNIDVSIIKDGYFGDASRMFIVGEASILAKKLVEVTKECLAIGIEAVQPGEPLNNVGKAIQRYVESHYFSVVRDFCGHGVGVAFHEPPQVLHYSSPLTTAIMQPGMIFTIEPMINAGRPETKILKDGWTAVTKDRSLSAQYEDAVLVTETGVEVLTRPSQH